MKHGYGKETFQDGRRYIGEYQYNKRLGKGEETDYEHSFYYEG